MHTAFFSTVDRTKKAPFEIDNKDMLQYVGSVKGYFFTSPNKFPRPSWVSAPLNVKSEHEYSQGSLRSPLVAVKELDTACPIFDLNSPPFQQSVDSAKHLFSRFANSLDLFPDELMEMQNTSPGAAAKHFGIKNKNEFLSKHPSHFTTFLKEVEAGSWSEIDIGGRKVIPIISQGFIKSEVTKKTKIDTDRQRLFSSESTDIQYVFEKLIGWFSIIFNYRNFPFFLQGYSPQYGGFNKLIESMRGAKFLAMGDCTTLDKTLYQIIDSFWDIVWYCLSNKAREHKNLFNFCKKYSKEHLLLLPTGEIFFVLWRLMSGLKITSMLGTLLHFLVVGYHVHKRYMDVPLNWWKLLSPRLMSDDHLFRSMIPLNATWLVEDYAECGLINDVKRMVIVKVEDFDKDIEKMSILGFSPRYREIGSWKGFVPVPIYPSKLIASVMTHPSKSKLDFYRRCAAIAAVCVFDDLLFNWLKGIIDHAISINEIRQEELYFVDEDGEVVSYPDKKQLTLLYIGVDVLFE